MKPFLATIGVLMIVSPVFGQHWSQLPYQQNGNYGARQVPFFITPTFGFLYFPGTVYASITYGHSPVPQASESGTQFLRTTDAGQTWSSNPFFDSIGCDIGQICFVSASHGYLAAMGLDSMMYAYHRPNGKDSGGIFETLDSGLHWRRISPNGRSFNSVYATGGALFAAEATPIKSYTMNTYPIQLGTILRSTNDGTSWDSIANVDGLTLSSPSSFEGIYGNRDSLVASVYFDSIQYCDTIYRSHSCNTYLVFSTDLGQHWQSRLLDTHYFFEEIALEIPAHSCTILRQVLDSIDLVHDTYSVLQSMPDYHTWLPSIIHRETGAWIQGTSCAMYIPNADGAAYSRRHFLPSDSSLFRSRDLGNTWQGILGNGVSGPNLSEIDDIDFRNISVVGYGAVVYVGGFLGDDHLYLTTDGGDGSLTTNMLAPKVDIHRSAFPGGSDTLFSDTCSTTVLTVTNQNLRCAITVFDSLWLDGLTSTEHSEFSTHHRSCLQLADTSIITLMPKSIGEHHLTIHLHFTDDEFHSIDTAFVVILEVPRYSQKLVSISPQALFLNDTILCDSVTQRVTLHSLGCAPAQLVGIQISGRDAANYQALAIDSGTFEVTLLPIGAGVRQATLIFGLSDGSEDSVSLNGFVAFQPDSLAVTPSLLFSGDTALCDSITRFVRVHRMGCLSPSISRVAVAGVSSASFRVGSTQSDSIPITLVPDTAGDKHAILVLARTDGKSDTVALMGSVAPRPISISIQPRRLFAGDTVRCDSVAESVTIHGAGCAPLGVNNFGIMGSDSSAYRLGALHSDSIDVSLISMVNGSHQASLVITMSNGTLDTVTLAGYVQREPNTVVLSVKTLFTGDTARCDTVTHVLSITKTGCSPPSIRSLSIVGANSESYRMTRSLDSISISLLPVTTGAVPALLVVQMTDGSSDTTFLNGVCSNEGGTVSVSPRVLFVNDSIRCDSISKPVAIHTGGCVPPLLVGWSISGPDSAGFVATTLSPDSLQVTLRPRSEGRQSAALVLRFNDGSRDTVALAGVNAPARTMALSTNALDLGALQPCESRDTAIPYTNTSCVPVTFIGWRMGHYGDGFQVYNKDYQPLTIPAGETDSLHITFDGRHTGVVYDTVILIMGTNSDSIRRIPVRTYIPPVDSVNFLVTLPKAVTPGAAVLATVLPDRSVSGKGLTVISGVIAFPTNSFHLDSITAPSSFNLFLNPPDLVGRTLRIAFALTDPNGITLDPASPVVRVWLRALLSDTNDYRISLDSVILNDSDPSYSNCTLATSSVGASAGYSPACGDSLLIQTLAMRELLFVDDPWPNPATEMFSVHLHNPSEQIVTYELVDALGITRNRGTTQQNELSVDLQDVPPGVYYLRVRVPIGSWEIRKIAVRK